MANEPATDPRPLTRSEIRQLEKRLAALPQRPCSPVERCAARLEALLSCTMRALDQLVAANEDHECEPDEEGVHVCTPCMWQHDAPGIHWLIETVESLHSNSLRYEVNREAQRMTRRIADVLGDDRLAFSRMKTTTSMMTLGRKTSAPRRRPWPPRRRAMATATPFTNDRLARLQPPVPRWRRGLSVPRPEGNDWQHERTT
jgi:hypothetical protein